MTNKIESILFDFDGTLLDTNELIIQTFLTVLNRHDPERFTREDVSHFIGPSLQDTFDSIDASKTEQWIDEYREWNFAHHDEYAAPFERVNDVLFALRDRGIRMAIVSTKRSDMIEKGLRLLEARGVFDEVVGLDHVTHAKPHPEPLERAMKAIDAKPETTLMVGDNYHDIEGGHNAGVRTAAVAWSLKGEDFLQTFHPTYMLQSMDDLLRIVDEVNR